MVRDFYKGRKTLISTVVSQCVLLTYCFTARIAADLSDLETLHIMCSKAFGNNYGRRNPPDDFGISGGAPFKHDANLQYLEASTCKLIGDDTSSDEKVLVRLLSNLAQDPHNADKLFRFAYACTLASTASSKFGGSFWLEGQHRYWNDILKWMLTQPTDESLLRRHGESSFEWLRVRYLVEGSALVDPLGIIPMGRHLLSMEEGDFQLTKVLSSQLGSVRRDAETKEALRLCQLGIEKWPTYPTFYAMESYIYETRWLGLGRKREDCEKAIQASRSALARVASKAYLEAPLKRRIDAMGKILAEYK